MLIAAPACRQAVDTSGQRIAFGCEGSHLSVWNIPEARCDFQARGPKPDRVGLVDKAANTAVAFLLGEGDRIVVGTARHKLMLYAPSEGRRPRFVVPFREGRVTALAPETSGECGQHLLLFPLLASADCRITQASSAAMK